MTGCVGGICRLGSKALNNEFFSKSCVEWTQRLSQGDLLLFSFTVTPTSPMS